MSEIQYRRETDRLLGELSANLGNVARTAENLAEKLETLEARLRHMESQISSGRGAIAVLMAFSGVLGYLAERIWGRMS
jgi:chromosome segregation ATPase